MQTQGIQGIGERATNNLRFPLALHNDIGNRFPTAVRTISRSDSPRRTLQRRSEEKESGWGLIKKYFFC
jgi:hypothetical protein